jgi:hypothetical protein
MVTNSGEQNDVVVFLRVTVPVKDVTYVGDDGAIKNVTYTQSGLTVDSSWDGNTGTPAHMSQELFYFKQADTAQGTHENVFNANWIEIPEEETLTLANDAEDNWTKSWSLKRGDNNTYKTDAGQRTYVFGYKFPIVPQASTPPLFQKVQLKNIIENELAEGQIQNIKVEAFSIQADNIIGAGGTIDTTELTHDELAEIYRIYISQNGHIVTKDDHDAGKYTDKAVGDMVYDFYQDAEHGMTEKEADISNLRNLKNEADKAVGTSIVSSVGDAKLRVGGTTDLTTTYRSAGRPYAENVNDCTTIESTDTNVVTVSNTTKDGRATLTAVGIGDASVIVTTRDGAKTAIHISVQNDARSVNGNDTSNDNTNIPSGSSQP